MLKKSTLFPFFLIYEVIRLFLILLVGLTSTVTVRPLSWYAAMPLLVVTPALFLMLSLHEARFREWLLLISFIKILSSFSFFAHLMATFFASIPSGFSQAEINYVILVITIIGIDLGIGFYCFWRYRRLCK